MIIGKLHNFNTFHLISSNNDEKQHINYCILQLLHIKVEGHISSFKNHVILYLYQLTEYKCKLFLNTSPFFRP